MGVDRAFGASILEIAHLGDAPGSRAPYGWDVGSTQREEAGAAVRDAAAAEGGADFGARLRALREAAGLTQEDLASKAGLTAKAVSAPERGERRRPYPHTVRSLAGAPRDRPLYERTQKSCARARATKRSRRQRLISPGGKRPVPVTQRSPEGSLAQEVLPAELAVPLAGTSQRALAEGVDRLAR